MTPAQPRCDRIDIGSIAFGSRTAVIDRGGAGRGWTLQQCDRRRRTVVQRMAVLARRAVDEDEAGAEDDEAPDD